MSTSKRKSSRTRSLQNEDNHDPLHPGYCVLEPDSETLSFVDSLQTKQVTTLKILWREYEIEGTIPKNTVKARDALKMSFTANYVDLVDQNNRMYNNVVVELPANVRGNTSGQTMYFSIKDVIGDGNCGWYSLAEQGFFDYSRLPTPYMKRLRQIFNSKKSIAKLDTMAQHRIAVRELTRMFYFGHQVDRKKKGGIRISKDKDFRAILHYYLKRDGYIFEDNRSEEEQTEFLLSMSTFENPQEQRNEDEIRKEEKKFDDTVDCQLKCIGENRVFLDSSTLSVLSYIFRKSITLLPIGGGLDMFQTTTLLKKVVVDRGSVQSILESGIGLSNNNDMRELNSHIESRTRAYPPEEQRESFFSEEDNAYVAHVFDLFPFDNYLTACPDIEYYDSTDEPGHFNLLV